jgi:uncharacterized protein YdbL (DUF1318 family)
MNQARPAGSAACEGDRSMFRSILRAGLGAAILLAACVTINVYFPAAQAEQAADRIINDVWGPATEQPATRTEGVEPQGFLLEGFDPGNAVLLTATRVADLLLPAAQAQADFDISTPEIRALTQSMNQRHQQLKKYYDAGAVGLTADGLVELRDRNAVPLAERNVARELVEAENRDRDALYEAIAQANGHPEWEDDIRKTFAERWVSKAGQGWWYRGAAGDWRQKS